MKMHFDIGSRTERTTGPALLRSRVVTACGRDLPKVYGSSTTTVARVTCGQCANRKSVRDQAEPTTSRTGNGYTQTEHRDHGEGSWPGCIWCVRESDESRTQGDAR